MNDEVAGPAEDDHSEASAGAQADQPIGLRCLAGGAFPDALRTDASRIQKLPAGVLKEMGHILRDCVLQPMTSAVGDKLGRFCQQHEVAEADLGGVMKVCGWLLHQASELDLSPAQLTEDVQAIFGDAGELGPILQAEYGPFKAVVRDQLLNDALVNHGKVLVDVDWRVDRIISERQAAKLDTPVALVTLAYRDVEGSGRLTLQITPDRLARLAQVFGALAQKTQMLPQGPRGDRHE
jgi:hypothetical protein